MTKTEYLNQMRKGLRLTHGESRRNKTSQEYRIWTGLRRRCRDEHDPAYPRYGGRGVNMCDRWFDSFETFLLDMGRCPPGHSLDRIDNEKGYSPANCRWSTPKEQSNNRRSNRRIVFNGEVKTLAQWSEIIAIPYHTLKSRTGRLGWSAERAFTEPVQRGRRRLSP